MAKTDKEILLEIMAGAFRESDRLRPILRKGKTEKRLKIMAAYAYDLAVRINGVYLSEDKTTAIVYWQHSKIQEVADRSPEICMDVPADHQDS